VNRTALFNRIRKYCMDNGDPKIVKKYSRYFKEGYDAYGLSHEIFERGIESLVAENKISLRLVLDTAPFLLKPGKYEETSFALALVKKFMSEFDETIFMELGKWYQYGINNWAHSDSISLDIVSEFLVRRIVPIGRLAPWLSAENKFQRRSVPVAFIRLIKTGHDFRSLFKFIEPLMTDEAREVHQGVGWFLREAWKINRNETEKFLLKWKNDSPRLIFQYATEKMTAAEKQRFRRTEHNNVKIRRTEK
jgi:3-methyladenine DNA glycosylase AlkD